MAASQARNDKYICIGLFIRSTMCPVDLDSACYFFHEHVMKLFPVDLVVRLFPVGLNVKNIAIARHALNLKLGGHAYERGSHGV